MKKNIIIFVALIILIISAIYFTPKLFLIYKFNREFGKEEVFQRTDDNFNYANYSGKYTIIKEDDITIKLPLDDIDSSDFSIEHDSCCTTYVVEKYKVTLIDLTDIDENEGLECANKFFLSYKENKLELHDTHRNRDELEFNLSYKELRNKYKDCVTRYTLLSEWGPKYCEGIAKFDSDNSVIVFAMFNDEFKNLDNYGVISIIVYNLGSDLYPYADWLIQVECMEGYSISEDEAMFVVNRMEVEKTSD